MDLLILLAIALAGVACVALVVMGLLIVPWLILLALFVLFFALLKVPVISQEQMAWSLEREADSEAAGESQAIASKRRPTRSNAHAFSQGNGADPPMVYRGAKYQPRPKPSEHSEAEETIEIVGTYRGKTCSLKVKPCTKD